MGYAYTFRTFIPDPNYSFDHAGRVYHKDKNGTIRRLKGNQLLEFKKLFDEELKKIQEKEKKEEVLNDVPR